MADRINTKTKRDAAVFSTGTHFSRREAEALLLMYERICRNYDRLELAAFRDILQTMFAITDHLFIDRVFRVFDRDGDCRISPREWIAGLSVFLRGTHDELTQFCFAVYDFNGDGKLGRDELFHLYKNAVYKDPNAEDPNEGVRDLVDIALKKMDDNQDGFVSFDDFRTVVQSEPALLQAFGPCLPPEHTAEAFLHIFSEMASDSRC